MARQLSDSLSKMCRALFNSRTARCRRKQSSSSSLSFQTLEPRQLLAAVPVISEFMASNDGTLLDEDGDSSDWIEVYNVGDTALDLAGWSLTDDSSDLAKWSFPSTTLNPNQSLLVFASGKDRAIAGAELHANFRLSAGGEYLALVEPDESTVAFDYTPEYPQQLEDVSYGLAAEGATTVLVDDSTLVRTLVPINGSLGNTWTDVSFDDSGWQGGPGVTAGVGYEAAPTSANNYAALINAPLTPTANGLGSAYARFEFQLNSVTDINQLSLAMQFDDGFVAHLNGVRVASANAPTSPVWNSLATGGTPDDQATETVDFDLTDHVDELVVGTNVLAFQLLNRSAGSSDLLLIPQLTAVQAAIIQPYEIGYFSDPTPGAPNNNNAQGFTAEPTFSVPRGFHDSAFDVTLATETAGADIYYTTNGSQPDETTGILYTGPITVDGTTTLKAIALKDDFFPSASVTHSYLFTADIINQSANPAGYPSDWGTHNNGGSPFLAVADYEIDSDVVGPNDLFGGAYNTAVNSRFEDALTSLPTISLTMDIDDAFDGETGFYANSLRNGREWERETSVEWWDPSDDSQFQVNAGIRAHGGVSRQPWRTPKHGLRLYFRNDYGPGRLEFPLFGDDGVTSFDRLVFRSHYNDSWQAVSSALHTRGQFIQDPFVRNSFAEMGNLSIRSRPTNVYINGLYWGVYDITERPDASYFADHLGGDSDDWDVINRQGTVQDGNADAWNELINLVRTTDLTTTAGYEAVKQKLDVQNLVDYMLVNFYAGVDDWPHNNWVAAKNRVADSPFRFYVWDAEIAMNQLGYNRTGVDDANSSAELYDRLRVNSDFRQLFIDRALLHLSEGGALSPEASIQRYTELGDWVKQALVAESARWGDVHPSVPLTVDNQWQNEFNWITNTYLPQRTDIFTGQLQSAGLASNLAAPTFGTPPGQVAAGSTIDLINNQSGATIYFTTDGTDPRESGGAVSGSAQAYSTAIPVNGVTNIAMRVLSGGNWSGLVSGLFLLAEPAAADNLRVTELHYNPSDPTPGEMDAGITDADSFEFLELKNVGTQSIDLNGVSIGGGIEFTFADTTILQPGEQVVIAADQPAFWLRYGFQPRVVGEYSGQLNNGGEDLLVRDTNNNLIQAFTYQDGNSAAEAGWPTTPDGSGPSLVVVDTSGDYSSPITWRASVLPGGTPSAPRFVAADIYRDGHAADLPDQLVRPDQIAQLEVRFDQDVTFDETALTLRSLTEGGTLIDLSDAQFEYVASTNRATWDLSSLASPLSAGFYQIQINSSDISSVASGVGLGIDINEQVYVALRGDANLDGRVDILNDGFTLVQNLGTDSTLAWTDGDFNGDGEVTILGDGFALVQNLGASVVPIENQSTFQLQAIGEGSSFESTTANVSFFVETQLDDDDQKKQKDATNAYAQHDLLMAEEDILVLS